VTVTHRLASVMHADRILVLDGGRLVEQGQHAALLAQGGVYAHLWEKQSGFVVNEDSTSATVNPTRLRAIPMFASLVDTLLQEIVVRFVTEHFPLSAPSVTQVIQATNLSTLSAAPVVAPRTELP